MIGKSTAAFITIVIWLGVSNAWSMQNEVRGVVTDAETSESLPGVNIRVKGTTTGGSTNINGEFSVGVSSLSDTLLFTFIGYQELEIPLEGRSEDRKSTRLNSSHVAISYAVFCLKKRK